MNQSKKVEVIILRAAWQVLNNCFETFSETIENTSGLLKSTTYLGVIASLLMPMASHGVAVTTHHNNNYRTGQNDKESVLNVSNVNVNSFGKLFSIDIAKLINVPLSTKIMENQVLYVPNVKIPGKGSHNAIYTCTVYNSCFAFDADTTDSNNTPLWQTTLDTVLPSYNNNNQGVRSTPVIDVASNTLYVVAKSNDGFPHFKLHALDITTGAEEPNSPVEIQGKVFGSASGNVKGILTFNPNFHSQRSGLLLLNGNIYIAFGSYDDYNALYSHGWIFSYNAKTLQLNSVISTSPDWNLASIWQSGNGIAADDNGYIYLHTGNSYKISAAIGTVDYSNSVLKIDTSNNGLKIVDYFTPDNHNFLNTADADLSSSGPLLIPGTSVGAGGGKDGILYVWNTDHLGGFSPEVNQVLQYWQLVDGNFNIAKNYYYGGFWEGNVYYDGSNRLQRPGKTTLYSGTRKGILFAWGESDKLKSVNFSNQSFDQINIATGLYTTRYPERLALSSNFTNLGTAILWTHGYVDSGPARGTGGLLRAFDALNISNLLWDSTQNFKRDNICTSNKPLPASSGIEPPTIANGKVYVSTPYCGVISVYGLLPK
jgi:hypothetical protein